MNRYTGWTEERLITQWPTLQLSEDGRAGVRRCVCGEKATHFILSGPVFLCDRCLEERRKERQQYADACKSEAA